jgi:hypothetical protein
MAHVSAARRPARQKRRGHGPLYAPFLLFVALTLAAAGYVGYVLWPRWPDVAVSLQAPALPIVIGGEMFNIEPAAIRQDVQRHSGRQQRVDLDYLWPSLRPPDQSDGPAVDKPVDPNARLFVSIAQADATLGPLERIKTIYPRYLAGDVDVRSDGLAIRGFLDDTPYQGEDLVYDQAAPESFVARCARTGVGNAGMCLSERRIGHADITMRFPRDWLGNWKAIPGGFNRLIARLHPQ